MTETEKAIGELIAGCDREELEKRLLAAFNLNAYMLGIIQALTSDIASGTDRREARENGRKLVEQAGEVKPVTSTKESA